MSYPRATSLAICFFAFASSGFADDLDGRESIRPERVAKPREAAPSPGPALAAVRFLSPSQDGWAVAESDHFRFYHHQTRDFVKKAAAIAEDTRGRMQSKWLGRTGESWDERCELYLYSTGRAYERATGNPTWSPGFAKSRTRNGRVIQRSIDLRGDDPNLLTSVLPHEVTHVVLAGHFGNQPLPRWADEGMAVLSEPRYMISHHLRRLTQYRESYYKLGRLMGMEDYPESKSIGLFYAESVSIVQFLVQEKDAKTFTQFLQDGMRDGYSRALRRNYGYRDFEELTEHWSVFAFGETTPLKKADVK